MCFSANNANLSKARRLNMSKFKVGDKVRRIGGSNFHVIMGGVYTVVMVKGDSLWVESEEGSSSSSGYSCENFDLVQETTKEQDLLQKVKEGAAARDELSKLVGERFEVFNSTVDIWVPVNINNCYTPTEYRVVAAKPKFEPFTLQGWDVSLRASDPSYVTIGCQSFHKAQLKSVLNDLIKENSNSYVIHDNGVCAKFYATKLGIALGHNVLTWINAQILLDKLNQLD